jgi:hypothetical protein
MAHPPYATITAKELLAALQTGIQVHPPEWQESGVDAIFRHAQESREPVPRPGSVWRDASGQHFRSTGAGGWRDFNGTEYVYSSPIRPLTKVASADHY